MRYLPIVRCSLIFPFAYLSGLMNKNASLEKAYKKCSFYSKLALKFMGYRLIVEGKENLQGLCGAYFVSNHQGTLDPCLVTASCDLPVSFISKKENENIPLLGMWAKNIGCIHFDRESRNGNVFMLRETLRYLKRKQNVLIFPEGTRSKSDSMNPFKEKALQPAMMAKATIVPVTLNRAYCLDRDDIKVKTLRIVYSKPISYEEYRDYTVDELSQKVFDIIQSNI